MTRFLFAIPLLTASLAATDLADLVPYLDVNSTAHFKTLVTDEESANARRSDNNKTVLMYAVWVGNEAAVDHLVARGADVNARDVEGVTPLLLSIYRDRTAIALKLIAHGADVNATAKDGSTPLIMSKFRGNKAVEEALLKASTSTQGTRE